MMDDAPAVKKAGCVPRWLKPAGGGKRRGRAASRAPQPAPEAPLNVDAIPGGLSGIQARMAAMGHGSNVIQSPPPTEVTEAPASGAGLSVSSDFVNAPPPQAVGTRAAGSRPPKPQSNSKLHPKGQPPSLMDLPKHEKPPLAPVAPQGQQGQQAGEQQAAAGAPMAGIGIRVRQSPNGERSCQQPNSTNPKRCSVLHG